MKAINNSYFITYDLESTAGISSDALSDIREETLRSLKKALSDKVKISVISYQEGVEFFSKIRKKDEFVIASEGGIYIPNPDYAFDSTRMYPCENAILEAPGSYTILTRQGKALQNQNPILIPRENEKNIGLYDDGLFSGDTIKAVLLNLPNSGERYKINVLLNFSGRDKVGNIPINGLYSGTCVDWIDERDFYYGVKNSGASINPGGIVSGVPYVSSPQMASKKASIPKEESKQFCISMLRVNKKLWAIINENAILSDIPRLQYLLARYEGDISIQDVLTAEETRIKSL